MSAYPAPAEMLHPFDASGIGAWTRRDATHLLWRTGFGATGQEIDAAFEAGPLATVERLVTKQSETSEFAAAEELLRTAALQSDNIGDLKAWWLYRCLHSGNPLAEKMTLFWHNHFATANSKVKSVRHMTDQNDQMRRHALGDFGALLQGMAKDVAMLIWLDSNDNRKRAPNENFARELMELFSLGVGAYSEEDIKQAARAFTGWHVRQDRFWFDRLQHDDGVKTVFGRRGAFDGAEIVELCLQQQACPRFLATKLLTSFVVPEPDEAMVERLAQRIRAHEFAFDRVMRDLLASKLFFSAGARHTIIKSPIDLVIGADRTLGVSPKLQATIGLLADLGQDLFEPPTVKGWEGGRQWINSATLLTRANFAAELTGGDRFGVMTDIDDLLGEVDRESTVDACVELLLARDLDPKVRDQLGLYVRNANGPRDQRSRGLVHLVLTMPEYQLM